MKGKSTTPRPLNKAPQPYGLEESDPRRFADRLDELADACEAWNRERAAEIRAKLK